MPDDSGDPPTGARRDRPETERSYGIPSDAAGLLPWSFVAETLASERTVWLSTTLPDGRPHARPVWGVWTDGTFHCGGGDRTRWVRNLRSNPNLTVHTESGTSVVILEGTATELAPETAAPERLDRVDSAYEEKYGIEHGTPVFAVGPRVVLAWTDFPTDATRWRFEGG